MLIGDNWSHVEVWTSIYGQHRPHSNPGDMWKPPKKVHARTGSLSSSSTKEPCNRAYWTFCTILCISLAVAVFQGAFGQGTGPLLLNDVKCTGRESSLLNCTHRKIGVTNCFYDVGVVCSHCKSCIWFWTDHYRVPLLWPHFNHWIPFSRIFCYVWISSLI